jgi:hypothetical protein
VALPPRAYAKMDLNGRHKDVLVRIDRMSLTQSGAFFRSSRKSIGRRLQCAFPRIYSILIVLDVQSTGACETSYLMKIGERFNRTDF